MEKHLIMNRRIFTDGYTSGQFATVGNLQVEFNGAWDDFTVSTTYNQNVKFETDQTNIQCSNGVLHCIKKILLN